MTVQALAARRRRARATRRPARRRRGRVALGCAALALAALFLVLVARTREPRPVRAGAHRSSAPGSRSALALTLTWLVPEIGLDSRDAERAVLALVAFGIVTRRDAPGDAASRCSGSCWSRTGSRSPRSSCRAASSLAIELGVALDLTLVALVAAVFHERIFAEFGAGDTAALRSLRD